MVYPTQHGSRLNKQVRCAGATDAARLAAQQASQGLSGVSGQARTDAQGAAGAGGIGAYERAIGGIDDVATAARNVAGQARSGGQTAAQQAAQQTQTAISGARGHHIRCCTSFTAGWSVREHKRSIGYCWFSRYYG